MTESEKFVNDFMVAFDENGLSAPPKIMYIRAYQEIEVLKDLKAKNARDTTQGSPNDCHDWIHNERVKQNDDTFCPVCGKQLQIKQPT